MQLGIDYSICRRFEKDNVGDTGRQMIEVIDYWLKNAHDCSWNTLATALTRIGGHNRLAEKLNEVSSVNIMPGNSISITLYLFS